MFKILKPILFGVLLMSSTPIILAAEIFPVSESFSESPNENYNIKIGDQTFSILDLEKMSIFETTFKTIWDVEGRFVGVKLVDLLNKAGISTFQRLHISAANDYKVTISSTDTGIENALIAFRVNGKTFALNEKGPFWLIWPDQSEAVYTGEEPGTKWIWSTVEIRKIR